MKFEDGCRHHLVETSFVSWMPLGNEIEKQFNCIGPTRREVYSRGKY